VNEKIDKQGMPSFLERVSESGLPFAFLTQLKGWVARLWAKEPG